MIDRCLWLLLLISGQFSLGFCQAYGNTPNFRSEDVIHQINTIRLVIAILVVLLYLGSGLLACCCWSRITRRERKGFVIHDGAESIDTQFMPTNSNWNQQQAVQPVNYPQQLPPQYQEFPVDQQLQNSQAQPQLHQPPVTEYHNLLASTSSECEKPLTITSF